MIDLQENALAAIAGPQPAGQLHLGVSNSLSDGPLPTFAHALCADLPQDPGERAHRVQYGSGGGSNAANSMPCWCWMSRAVPATASCWNPARWSGSARSPGNGIEASRYPLRPSIIRVVSIKAATTALDRARILAARLHNVERHRSDRCCTRRDGCHWCAMPHALQPGTSLFRRRWSTELPSVGHRAVAGAIHAVGGVL